MSHSAEVEDSRECVKREGSVAPVRRMPTTPKPASCLDFQRSGQLCDFARQLNCRSDRRPADFGLSP